MDLSRHAFFGDPISPYCGRLPRSNCEDYRFHCEDAKLRTTEGSDVREANYARLNETLSEVPSALREQAIVVKNGAYLTTRRNSNPKGQ